MCQTAVVAPVSTHINSYALSVTSMLVAHFNLPIARKPRDLKLIAEWLECQMSVQVEGPRCQGVFRLACQAPKGAAFAHLQRDSKPPSFRPFHQHSHIQPHHIHFTSLWTFNSQNPRR